MIELLIETSSENAALARGEAAGACAALGGRLVDPSPDDPPDLVRSELAGEAEGAALAARLALARRVLVPWSEQSLPEILERLSREAERGESASVRPLGRPTGGRGDRHTEAFGRAWRDGGGAIDLARPARRFYHRERPGGRWLFAEGLAEVDRTALSRRRMPFLPFQRPVSLAPRLARAAANLARIRPGDRVVDPFVGTGALLLEAALLGARVYGVDRDATMVRGAIQNLRHVGVEAERLIVADSGEAAETLRDETFDVVLTDPPYGRASARYGESPIALVARVLPAWADRLGPLGRVVTILPYWFEGLGTGWRATFLGSDRVHRSLTRRFQAFERVA